MEKKKDELKKVENKIKDIVKEEGIEGLISRFKGMSPTSRRELMKKLGIEPIITSKRKYENFVYLKTLKGHSGAVLSVIETKDGKLVSASSDNTIKIWDPNTKKCLKTLTGHSGKVFSVIETKDGKLISTSLDNTIKIWDPNTGECIKELIILISYLGSVRSVIETKDGKLVSTSSDNTIKI